MHFEGPGASVSFAKNTGVGGPAAGTPFPAVRQRRNDQPRSPVQRPKAPPRSRKGWRVAARPSPKPTPSAIVRSRLRGNRTAQARRRHLRRAFAPGWLIPAGAGRVNDASADELEAQTANAAATDPADLSTMANTAGDWHRISVNLSPQSTPLFAKIPQSRRIPSIFHR